MTANYDGGAVEYTYDYDVAGNLVNNNGVTRTYNAANQMTNDGTNTLTYDNNGNLTNDGVNAYTWDRANRMLTALGSTSYKYDGAGNRISQTVSGVVTAYLNDVQPGLTQLLAETVSGNTTRYVQGVRGIHATESHAGVWSYFAQDGLGSVRGIVDDVAAVVSSQSYNPIGVPVTDYGKGFGFTGEYTDNNDLLYLRARYYAPSKGVFTALDPFEGMQNRPMSLNGYSWVEGNMPNAVDPTGMLAWDKGLGINSVRQTECGMVILDAYPVEQNDCLSCIAKEGGLFNSVYWQGSQSWTDAYPSGPFYEKFTKLIQEVNGLPSPDVINYPGWLLVPKTFSIEPDQYGEGIETRYRQSRSVNIELNGLANQGTCYCQYQCPSYVDCNAPRPESSGCSWANHFRQRNDEVRSVGHVLYSFSAHVIAGGSITIFAMWDVDDVGSDQYVVYYTLGAGVGIGAETNLTVEVLKATIKEGIRNSIVHAGALAATPLDINVITDATLDGITGLSGQANVNLWLYTQGISVSSNGCATGTSGFGLGYEVSADVTSTDVIYDGRTDTWFPNSWFSWII